ncbi:D-alanyl-D-alanine carboxypeptidase [Actinoplanes lutulentus]|uniref:D-alanyl-D-alanine carboxypeptidase n=1 Tax=Actinoplanes lutulentus TaxID=1287878 RepID=A0A327ZQ69_9ACTN|nr:serine hydrolase domain-containing protein [Actinoplanes lutulentus]MBB2940667.1 D-alanyl-D-alanine carboxypeptidase [Actinoplanes lutulentus]RAK42978.1 D-alanyl-D-alanine carboxypeptidase [Actinoplanes lutulentus]
MPDRRAVLTGSAAAVFAASAGITSRAEASAGGKEPGGLDRAALQAALDQIVGTGATAALARVDSPSGSWRGASGVARLGHPARPVPGGRFRIGSITKTFVATVILQLVGEDRLRLDDTLERWLPGAVPGGARITIRHLLQHTSGLFNYTEALFGSVEDVLDARYRTFRPEELVALAAERPPLFEPGTSWSYSNTNYILLGLIVRRVTGRPYAKEVERRILRPLRLTGTEVPGTDTTIDGPHAHGYEPIEQNGEIVPLDFTDLNPSMAYAAGEIVSTTADLNRFFRSLLGGRLLRRPQLAEMLANPVGEIGYGLGIFQQPLPGGPTLWGHDGGIFGYLTYSFSTPDAATQLTVSINPWLGDFGEALLDLALTAFGVTAPAARATATAGLFPALGIRLPKV